MSTKIYATSLTAAALALGAGHAGATTVLAEKDNVQAIFTGFAEFDAIHDSTRSLKEVEGNGPIAKKGSYEGDNGRTQFSVRNSRLGFGLLTNRGNGWKGKGYIELDLLGYEPEVNAGVSEAGYYQNPTVRVRHAYLQAESNDGWNLIAGQYWSLFGWQSDFVPSTVGYAPIPGVLYERTPQATVLKTWGASDDANFTAGLSLSRPIQRESAAPNVDAGLRFRLGNYRAAYTSTSGDVKAEPLSIALSGTSRQITRPKADADGTYAKHKEKSKQASAFAVDVMIPLVSISKADDAGNSLALQAEFTKGTGYADELSGWTGNVAGVANGSAAPAAVNLPNLDSGFVGYKAGASDFTLVHLQTWNSSLQYHLPTGMDSWVTAGFAETWSDNVADLGAAAGKTLYTRSQAAFGNVLHDFSKEIRAGLEYNWARTRYVDNSHAQNARVQVSTWYRF